MDRLRRCQSLLSRVDHPREPWVLPVSDGAVVQINERRLEGLDQIASRLDWIRANRPQVSLTIEGIFFQGDRGFDHHTTTFSDGDSHASTIKVFGYIEMRGGKVALYEDVSIALDGRDQLSEATGVQTT